MATFCLLPKTADAFIEKIRSGELDPQKLSEMSSAERRKAFEFVGEENAHKVNALFESKLLLKNQEQGMINWVKQLTGLKPEAKRDLIARVNKLEKVLSPSEQKAFLEDLVSQRLGATVTLTEAAKISELAKEANLAREAIDRGSADASPSRLAWGRAQVKFLDYVSDLKNQTKKLGLQDIKNAPLSAVGRGISNLGGLAKSLKATLDNSVIGRQGLKVLFTNPSVWLRNSAKSFSDMVRTFGGQAVMDEVRAEVLSRENALNGLYKKEGLAVGTIEEAFPTSLPERIPVLGRVFKGSETAFTAFQYRTRADIFDKYVEIAKKAGVEDFSGIGKIANSLTGRGTFGPRAEAGLNAVNNVFFSPRLLKANIDLLTFHGADKGISPFARKQAAKNFVKVIGGIATILTIADAVAPGSVEKDPRSADFGKIRVGDTRFDVTGGMASLVTLVSRIITHSTKSSTTGKVTQLNARDKKGDLVFGGQTTGDVFINFLEGKLSPLVSVLKDIANQNTFSGQKPTVVGETRNLFEPLPITTYLELKNNPNSAPILASIILDGLGISTNTYSAKQKKRK